MRGASKLRTHHPNPKGARRPLQSNFVDTVAGKKYIQIMDAYFYTVLAIGLSCGIYLLTRGLAMYVGEVVANKVAAILSKPPAARTRKL